MPQGKGTYGSQIGRPSKKKYQAGGVVDENVAVLEAAQMGKELESIPLEGIEPEFPIETLEPGMDILPETNAMDRSQTFQVGGKVLEYKEGKK